ncbi:MAG: AAA family ATPase [Gammaproteobacteria bacterium]
MQKTAAQTLPQKELESSINNVIAEINQVILGKEHVIRLAITCLIAKGHLLIEDLPGVGKTTLAHVLANVLGLDFHRIQFTSDMLPADILGVSVYEQDNARFKFHHGPIFAQLILADEVNRATPKTQSALLEAMEEYQVTTEGETHSLPKPFFVIATQNPANQIGTFPLPESQLDRFMMRIEMGYPDQSAERALLKGKDRRDILEEISPCISTEALICIQKTVPNIHCSDALINYIQAILSFTRSASQYHHGLSPRAGLALLRCAQAWALMDGRNHVLPEDVQTILPGVVSHRLQAADGTTKQSTDELMIHLAEVPVL